MASCRLYTSDIKVDGSSGSPLMQWGLEKPTGCRRSQESSPLIVSGCIYNEISDLATGGLGGFTGLKALEAGAFKGAAAVVGKSLEQRQVLLVVRVLRVTLD